MKYVKVFTDFGEVMETLRDEEKGRLFTAMLAYARDGIEPRLPGNERFIWAVARQTIDREKEAYERKVKHLRRGRGPVSEEDGPVSEEKASVSEEDKGKDEDNDKDEDKDKDEKKEDEPCVYGGKAPTPPAHTHGPARIQDLPLRRPPSDARVRPAGTAASPAPPASRGHTKG